MYNIPLLVLLCAGAVPGARGGACCAGGALLQLDEFRVTGCRPPAAAPAAPVQLACPERSVALGFDYEPEGGGSLALYDGDLYAMSVPEHEYCYANLTQDDYELFGINASEVLVVCEEVEEERYFQEELVGACLGLSVACLVLTALLYGALPELRDLQGLSVVNLCGSLAAGLALLAVLKLADYSDMQLCAARGMFTYFFLIAGFFWMNSIAIQFLLMIRRPTVRVSGRPLWRALGGYALYAWGGAALLSAALAAVNFAPGRHAKPGIGLNTCWFISRRQQWQYMYSVMAILTTVNAAIFVYASLIIWRHSFHSTNIDALKRKFAATCRLFVLMGLPWIFEMAASLTPHHIVWEVLDLVNALQGVLLLAVLVLCEPRARRALGARLLPARCAAAPAPDDTVYHTELPTREPAGDPRLADTRGHTAPE